MAPAPRLTSVKTLIMFAEKSVSFVQKLSLNGHFIYTVKDFIPKSSLLILIIVFVKKQFILEWNPWVVPRKRKGWSLVCSSSWSQIVNPLSFIIIIICGVEVKTTKQVASVFFVFLIWGIKVNEKHDLHFFYLETFVLHLTVGVNCSLWALFV